jgi:hypothetical protein
MIAPFLAGVAPSLLTPPLNVMRLSFHPQGLAPLTVNLAEWCGHLLERLHRQCEATADPVLIALYEELKTYPIPARKAPHTVGADSLAVPYKIRMGDNVLSFISTTMVFDAARRHAVGTGAGDVLSGRRIDHRNDAIPREIVDLTGLPCSRRGLSSGFIICEDTPWP